MRAFYVCEVSCSGQTFKRNSIKLNNNGVKSYTSTIQITQLIFSAWTTVVKMSYVTRVQSIQKPALPCWGEKKNNPPGRFGCPRLISTVSDKKGYGISATVCLGKSGGNSDSSIFVLPGSCIFLQVRATVYGKTDWKKQ